MRFLIIFIFFISFALANETPKIKNIVVNKELKTYTSITFQDINKNTIKLSDYKGSLVMLNFWASWCAPCKEEMPHLDKLISKKKFKDIKVIPINIADENLKKSKEFFDELNIKKLEIFYGSSLNLAKEFKLRGIPTTIFIDKEGYEFARAIGFIDFENKSFLDWLSNQL